jgi:hypothetical protein
VLGFVLRHGKVRLSYQPSVIRKFLLVNETFHSGLRGYMTYRAPRYWPPFHAIKLAQQREITSPGDDERRWGRYKKEAYKKAPYNDEAASFHSPFADVSEQIREAADKVSHPSIFTLGNIQLKPIHGSVIVQYLMPTPASK